MPKIYKDEDTGIALGCWVQEQRSSAYNRTLFKKQRANFTKLESFINVLGSLNIIIFRRQYDQRTRRTNGRIDCQFM